MHGREAWCLKERDMGNLQKGRVIQGQVYMECCSKVKKRTKDYRSDGYGKQCSLVWSCLEKGITF